MKYLVIVESPAKKKPIEKYLGKDYEVKASFGHVRDLPSKTGSVLPDKNFEMKYVNSDKSTKHIQEIEKASKKANIIYLATDPDREGEAIAWHISEILRENKLVKNKDFIKRISFNEITKKAVTAAVNNPRDIDINLVNAQQARRALDYLVGFTLSPILWRKLPGCKSAGRVQSVALKLICEREDEIEKFKTQEYWNITLNLLNSKEQPFSAKLSHAHGKKLEKFSITTEEKAKELVSLIKIQNFTINSLENKQQKRNPPPPFITSTLQQEAARKLGFSPKKTMQVAQKLYEGINIDGDLVGLITYMRTDGVTLASDAVESIRDIIKNKFGSKYLPSNARIYKSKQKNAQEAHEAIRPTDINISPETIKNSLESDYLKLYDLIWKRTIACQMENVIIDIVTALLISKDKEFEARASGSTIIFDGFYKIYKEDIDDSKEEESNILPPLTEKEKLALKKVIPSQHFTDPPPRYSEASLIKTLEEKGIGRPSTMVSILTVLQDRGYASLVKKRFIPDEKGRLVTTFLIGFFKKYVEYDFTALLESELDDVAAGNLEWKTLLRQFWDGFNQNVDEVSSQNITDIINYVEKELDYHLFSGDEKNKICTSCSNGKFVLKLGKFGAFLGCNNYPDCNFKKQITNSTESSEEDVNNILENNNKTLGINGEGVEIYLKKGPYGWYVQEGEKGLEKEKQKETKSKKSEKSEKDKKQAKSKGPKRVSLFSALSPETITLGIALKLLSLPLTVGLFPNTTDAILLGVGRFGPYIKYQDKFISIPKNIDPFSITIDIAVTLIINKEKTIKKKTKSTK